MNHTENYQLCQWEAPDPIRREDFNADNAALDAALSAIRQAADSKADAEDVAALAANMGAVGKNARVTWGSYIGDGTYGADNPTTLTFDFVPVLVAVNVTNTIGEVISWLVRPYPYTLNTTSHRILVTWNDHSISWYYADSTSGHINQNNTSGYEYHYLALGYDT